MNKRLFFKSHGSYDVAERGLEAGTSEYPFHFPRLKQTNSTSHASSILSQCLEHIFSYFSPRIMFCVKLPWTNLLLAPGASRLHKARAGHVHCCCAVTQSCPTLCNPMDCSTPGFPGLNRLPGFAQAPVHWVGDAIQPSHSLSSPSPPVLRSSCALFLFPARPHLPEHIHQGYAVPCNELEVT